MQREIEPRSALRSYLLFNPRRPWQRRSWQDLRTQFWPKELTSACLALQVHSALNITSRCSTPGWILGKTQFRSKSVWCNSDAAGDGLYVRFFKSSWQSDGLESHTLLYRITAMTIQILGNGGFINTGIPSSTPGCNDFLVEAPPDIMQPSNVRAFHL